MATVKGDHSCTLCPLHEKAQTVCLMGRGKITSEIMVVGEAPGYREDEENRPFAGAAGQEILDPALEALGVDRDDIYITNRVRCRPPDNRTPRVGELRACNTWMEKELRVVKPKYVLLLGKTAMSLCPLWGRSSKITDIRGKFEKVGDTYYFATYHPAACLPGRDPRGQKLKTFQMDLSMFMAKAQGRATGHRPLDIRYVTDLASFEKMVERIRASTYVSFDLETTSLNQWDPDSKIVSAQFGLKDEQWYWPVSADHTLFRHRQPFKTEESRKLAWEIVADALRGKKLITQNGKFDLLWVRVKYGVKLEIWVDTLPLGQLIDENTPNSLSYQSSAHFAIPNYEIPVEEKQGYNISMKKHSKYACRDVLYTRMLAFKLLEELKKDGRLRDFFWTVFMPAFRNLVEMQFTGVYVNPKKFQGATSETYRLFGTAIDALNRIKPNIPSDLPKKTKKEMAEKGGINWGSPKQVAHYLYSKLELPILETTKHGAPKTDESVLKRLASLRKKKRDRLVVKRRGRLKIFGSDTVEWFRGHKQDVPKLIVDYRRAKKLREFIDSWTKFQDHRHRMHPNFKVEAVTGRGSCENPNIQQTPRNKLIRSCVDAPPGYVHVAGDYSQIELRLVAHEADERTMKRIFKAGGDIHAYTVQNVIGIKDFTEEDRKKAKAVNFGFIYGMEWRKFQKYGRDKYDVVFTDEESMDIREAFFARYYGLEVWHKRQRRRARSNGYVRTPMGRKRNLPSVWSSDEHVAKMAERQAINSPIQGGGAELKYAAMNDIAKVFKGHIRMNSEIHDELLMWVKKASYSNDLMVDLKNTMENPSALRRLRVKYTVPIVVELRVGPWGIGERWAG